MFLGTSGSAPTAQRAPAATLVRRGGDRILVDCAEGTQRQLLRSEIGLVDLPEILITHFHADHYLGLPGMLKTFSLRGRELPLVVAGPVGLNDLLATLRRVFGRLSYPVDTLELQAGDTLERDGYAIRAIHVEHGVPALGYAFRRGRPTRPLRCADGRSAGRAERAASAALCSAARRSRLPDGTLVTPDAVLGPARAGRTIVLTGDTGPAASVVEAAAGADLLVHEATFCADERERARETGHSTAGEAALLAREAGVRMLALTHLSGRYFGSDVAEEARQLFPETVVPRDFDVIEVPFAERGAPHLIPKGARRRRAGVGSNT